MNGDFANKSNKNNLKLRKTYKRYFIWGSKEKPGFGSGIKKPKIDYSIGFKTRLEKANSMRLLKKAAVLLLYFIIVLVVGYIVFKM